MSRDIQDEKSKNISSSGQTNMVNIRTTEKISHTECSLAPLVNIEVRFCNKKTKWRALYMLIWDMTWGAHALMQRTLQATCHGPGTNLGSSGMANSRATRSDVWEYFRKLPDDSKHVKCEVCDKKFAYLGGTTNLRTHLTSVHHINLKLSERWWRCWESAGARTDYSYPQGEAENRLRGS